MKKPERQFVTLKPQVRKGNGKTSWLLTFTAGVGNRMRLTFSDEREAIAEADRVEGLFQHGHAVAARVLKPDLIMMILLAEQMPGVKPHEIMQFYIDQHGGRQNRLASVEQIGNAFMATRSILANGRLEPTTDYSVRHQETIRTHVKRFIRALGQHQYAALTHEHYQHHLDKEIGGAPKTRQGHLITLRSMAHWARDVGSGKEKFLPPGPTAPDLVKMPENVGTEHEVYSAEEFTRLLIATPGDLIMFLVLGQLAGIRAQERERMTWGMWRHQEDGKLVLNRDVTKTKKRRRVDVLPSLALWLAAFRRDDDMPMVGRFRPHKYTAAIAEAAGVPWKSNALRAGYASYHLELFDDAALTAKNDGHSLNELETDYKSIKGVTKDEARKMFDVTPQSVLAFAVEKGLPSPDWARMILQIADA